MMADVVAVIPAFMVVFGIDTGNTVFICVVGLAGINECVLCPVAHHHDDPGNDKGNDQYCQGSGEADERQSYTGKKKDQLSPGRFNHQFLAVLADKILAEG
jgi:hypothetical protein